MYITADELIAAFSRRTLIQLSNDDSTATEVGMPVVELAIKTACERIDAALRSRYQLPLVETPTVISNHCLFLARYWLYARRPEKGMPELVKDTYNQSVKELEQIAQGRLHLGIAKIGEAVNGESAVKAGNDLLKDSGEYKVKAPTRLDTGGY
ncbi:DUF1320 domain-containing protein [Pasteurellaceae bacterium USgator11]|nr:DUF1320 domain-containing protein [Pasteurellaceae bacterium USgator41]TNG98707.1 DUF1320 domain-containing protein [Pasteurellaceae bacterium UScroc31]TNH00074.1 DUF1320 domain-containing protein [Pasteurellaceae bacterium USgator11]